MSNGAAFALVFVGIATVTDLRARVVPNALVVAFALLGVTFCHSEWSWLGCGVGLALGFVGALAPGDGKALGLLGGLLGLDAVLVLAAVAHGTVLALLGAFTLGWMPYAGRWPLMPFISAAVYGTVLARVSSGI